MSDQKSTDDENNDPFNEDFDFGESETEVRTTTPSSASGLNTKVLGAMVVVVLGVIGTVGYKIYKPKLGGPATTAATKKTADSDPKIATKELTAPKKSEAHAAASRPTTTPNTSQATDQNFGDIASAFSSSDQASPATAEHTPGSTAAHDQNKTSAPNGATSHGTEKQETNVSKDNNIQTMKKELFTTEKVNNSTTTTTVTTAKVNDIVKDANPNVPTHQEVVQLSDGLNKLNHQIDYILNQIKYLDSYSREVSDNLNKLNDSISAMDNRISTLTNTTSSLSKDMGNVRNEVGHVKQVLREDGLDVNLNSVTQKKKSAGKDAKVSIEEPEYTVHAVIPGRAWLKSSKGQIITVAEGDTIGNYGKILVIDAANGVVLTSSGIAFR